MHHECCATYATMNAAWLLHMHVAANAGLWVTLLGS